MNDYSQWVNDEEDLDPDVIAVLMANRPLGLPEVMLYATKGRAETCRSLNPRNLELLAVAFYERLNYKKVIYSGRHVSTDAGLDVWLQNINGDIEGVQCKKYSVRVGKSQVIEFARALRKAQAQKGYFWSPSGFSAPAVEYAKKIGIDLYDDRQIDRTVFYVFKEEAQFAREWLVSKIQELKAVRDIDFDSSQMIPPPAEIPKRVYSKASVQKKVKTNKPPQWVQGCIIIGLSLALGLVIVVGAYLVLAGK